MWRVIAGLFVILLIGCSPAAENTANTTKNITELQVANESNNTISNITVNESAPVNESASETNISTNESNATNVSNISIQNYTTPTGNYVRFYVSTMDGLQEVALSERAKGNFSGKVVEVVLIGTDNGMPRAILRVNEELSKPIEEKKSEIISGTYIFIMEILYKD